MPIRHLRRYRGVVIDVNFTFPCLRNLHCIDQSRTAAARTPTTPTAYSLTPFPRLAEVVLDGLAEVAEAAPAVVWLPVSDVLDVFAVAFVEEDPVSAAVDEELEEPVAPPPVAEESISSPAVMLSVTGYRSMPTPVVMASPAMASVQSPIAVPVTSQRKLPVWSASETNVADPDVSICGKGIARPENVYCTSKKPVVTEGVTSAQGPTVQVSVSPTQTPPSVRVGQTIAKTVVDGLRVMRDAGRGVDQPPGRL